MAVEARDTRIVLTNDNYAQWLIPMEAKLHKLKSLHVVMEKIRLPILKRTKITPSYTSNSTRTLKQKFLEVLAYVSATLPITDKFNGVAIWKLLKSHYAGGDLASQTTALAKFNHLAFTSIAKFIPDIRSANQAINMSGCIFDDRIRVNQMLSKLPSEFQSFRDIISMGNEHHSFEVVLKKLENYVAMNNLDHEASSIATSRSVQTAMNSRSEKPNNSSGSVCEHCKTPGHRISNCWKKFPEKAPKSHQAHMAISDNANQLASQEIKATTVGSALPTVFVITSTKCI
ncbi:hypothetical protein PSHT_14963 [Puccinia striiformis]|uniref:DUF4219 domain-containing protein n=1 Tax=Puccinia striiformis TaxID=27350 RepID=A0A2S4UHN7_9BASI|nr:hypothetical protein PSHT_14963 [Puccinia striiformis]